MLTSSKRGNMSLNFFYIFCLTCAVCSAIELTFELKDNAKDCFYEDIEKDVKAMLEYQVVTGGNYDVDVLIKGPSNNEIYKQTKKQYDSYHWTTTEKGIYQICFSNEFSTFTHKTVYMDLQSGKEIPIVKNEHPGGAMTQMETSANTIHEALKVVVDYQTHFKLKESSGRIFAEDLNDRVMLWSIGESVIVLLVGLGQVLVLRSFFAEKRTSSIGSIRT